MVSGRDPKDTAGCNVKASGPGLSPEWARWPPAKIIVSLEFQFIEKSVNASRETRDRMASERYIEDRGASGLEQQLVLGTETARFPPG